MSTKKEQDLKKLKTQGERLQYFMDLEEIKSQQMMADIIGISKSAVNRVLTNAGNFKIENYIKLYEMYELSPNWLILGVGSMYLNGKNLASIISGGQISPEYIEAMKLIVREELNQLKKELRG
jgi:hypothetical protein